ncbi:related to GPI transamidase complex, GPI17/PIG-S component, involved in glycosylphosphatidylinositol anchor biosynthesis [Ramularia collo-cygni]|uniref:Related to GPI transamidase complex, GPI17/PIG-S component, involved in glycosylphosphatidylinositol anchor biosynthesis n=1 Tax=Ramularia collo-cygni TaxID=112498 RepID=A0A2D3UWY9_9PEZI|nr:related to GPI transamidase complex, GPI17/PIG-S component, involved in glycosylphosphatidylinositol anchor biosynthesis [Ramularia collo-cygni]CZT15626.1 related to GPI transamidase complex, GPI17/PIG-S component, involved in glycosylphosphatidylinositol anchor biosynthesis [Ramularia collo-cygni]
MESGSSSAIKTSPESKEAPPERPAAVWTRRVIIAAFWAVALFLGLPHWTWTTSLHRSTLPLEAMSSWAEGQACQLQYPLHISLQSTDLPRDQLEDLTRQTESVLNNWQTLPLHRYILSAGGANVSDSALVVQLETSDIQDSKATLRPWGSILDVQHGLRTPEETKSAALFIATEMIKLFEDERASLFRLLKDSAFSQGIESNPLSPERIASLDGRTTRAFKYASSYHLTFSLFTPAASPSAWEIDEALERYISPLLAPLSSISSFTIDTQVQLYAAFSPSIAGPVFKAEQNKWTLHYGDLTGFVNAAEWPLSPGIGSGPTINFVLYVPSPDQRPLVIEENEGTSWIIPQWGGVQILNPMGDSTSGLTEEDLRPVMHTFADQLAALLGVPPTPASLSLRIASLFRERATTLVLSASSTLGALSRLSLKLTSIAIPDSVAKSVDETLHRLEKACGALQEGKFQSALEHARVAEAEVEKAFFEPSMVGQVYFPEEHKVAVYVPLLGPMAVPLIMSALKELKKLREKKQKGA